MVDSESAPPRRINVAVTPQTLAALDLVMDTEHVSLTEALRRLARYGEFVYRAVKERGDDVLVGKGDTLRRVELL